jgi:two-component system, OmpR family, alkaline phosphatase synthesis response regulator PhoP
MKINAGKQMEEFRMLDKILVADDEAHIVHVVSMKLVRAGFDVITAKDGEEALELCFSEHPDLVITDYQMPLLDGMGFCQKLRARPDCVDIPVIMLTARGGDLDKDELRELGVVALMEKPFSPREIHARARAIIDQRRQELAATSISA